jgi:hypothetical protein
MEMMGNGDVDGRRGKMEENRSRCGSVQVQDRRKAEGGSLAQKK